MATPSPFEIGRAVGGNLSGAFQQERESRSLDEILKEAMNIQDPNAMQNAYSKLIRDISPQNREQGMKLLQMEKDRQQKQLQAQAYQQAGLNPNLPEGINKELIKGRGKGAMSPEAQKWAYKELEKKPAIASLDRALTELEMLNKKGVSGPITGNVPSALASSEADAVRKAMDANAIQILNVHKSMFPRGLTQGEFRTLSQKLVSSKNRPEANAAIIKAYRGLADMQKNKVRAVEQAVKEYGFDPMLPFIVSGIQKEYEDAEAKDNQKLFQLITGEQSKEAPEESSESINIEEEIPTGNGAKLSVDIAQKFVQKAKGDKKLARQMAKEKGYVF